MIVKKAPIGGNLVVTINQGGIPWIPITLPAGLTQIDVTSDPFLPGLSLAQAYGPLQAGAQLTLDVDGDGGWSQSPENLSIAIYF